MDEKLKKLYQKKQEGFQLEVLKLLNKLGYEVPVPAPTEAPKPAARQVTKQLKKVLIIDDNPGLRASLTQILEQAGYRAVDAHDGKHGLAVLGQNPDTALILLDEKMPVMDGSQFLQLAKSLKVLESIPVIMMTERSTAQLVQQAKHFKVRGLLVKPFDADVILKSVAKVVPIV